MNMKILSKAVKYLKSPTQCYIPKCKAHCCIDVPLPEGFIERFQSRIQRSVYGGLNIGVNDPKDTYNSIVYSTRPIQIVHIDRVTGEKLYGISKEMMEAMNLKSLEDVNELLRQYEAQKIYNYCPFITDDARCSVYNYRPDICREFGSSPAKADICPEKSSRLDIIKFEFSEMFNFKNTIESIKSIFHKKSKI